MPKDKSSARGRSEQGKTAGRWRSWLLAALLVAALVVAVLHWGDVKKFAELIGRARPEWLAGALALQVATYVLLSLQWRLVLGAGDHQRPMRKLLPLTISKLFADQVVPTAGVSGNLLLVDRLKRLGVPRDNAVAAVILSIMAFYLSYAVCAVAALAMLWSSGDANVFAIGIVGLFLLVAAAIPSAALWMHGRGRRSKPGWLERIGPLRELVEMIGEAPPELVRDKKLIVRMAALNLGVFLADAATMLVCLLAIGQPFQVEAAFVPFIIASIAVTLGPIPLGLGSFEAVSVGMMRLLGLPLEAAISATLLFRGFVLWLPLILGFFVTRRDLRRSRR
jgi:uncharacterized protein (TIRG00374 family)